MACEADAVLARLKRAAEGDEDIDCSALGTETELAYLRGMLATETNTDMVKRIRARMTAIEEEIANRGKA